MRLTHTVIAILAAIAIAFPTNSPSNSGGRNKGNPTSVESAGGPDNQNADPTAEPPAVNQDADPTASDDTPTAGGAPAANSGKQSNKKNKCKRAGEACEPDQPDINAPPYEQPDQETTARLIKTMMNYDPKNPNGPENAELHQWLDANVNRQPYPGKGLFYVGRAHDEAEIQAHASDDVTNVGHYLASEYNYGMFSKDNRPRAGMTQEQENAFWAVTSSHYALRVKGKVPIVFDGTAQQFLAAKGRTGTTSITISHELPGLIINDDVDEIHLVTQDSARILVEGTGAAAAAGANDGSLDLPGGKLSELAVDNIPASVVLFNKRTGDDPYNILRNAGWAPNRGTVN